ncbi:hypothetical protein CWC18_20600 [Pseudoalteromonas aurantia]|uniref:tandem-95 repeat protein n=1 Tax=Pseudoalteromonas aurantia TaxID=43654 RepID=UPI00110A58EB|nr:Ig-like domain-containing protein [Pseudoalteromonas aurantia]TMO54832.1 hypothetical protein CWC18_20600 [Pseudoalteromonas aurantia]
MTIKRREWIAALFTRPYEFTHARANKKVGNTISTFLVALYVLFFAQSVKAIECNYVHAEGLQIRCANYSMVNDNLFNITYHQSDSSSNTAQLVYVSNPSYIVEEVPHFITKGETYTFTNNLSTQSPKQTITVTWSEGNLYGFDSPTLSHNPNTNGEFHLSSNQLHIDDYQGLHVISDIYHNSINLADNAYDNHLFQLEHDSHIRFNDQANITLGEYQISVTLENHNEPSLNVTKQFTIEVVDHVTLSGRPKTSIYQNQTYTFSPLISHSDHLEPNDYSFHIENKPTWATFDTRQGILQGTPTEDDLGTTEQIHIYVTDGKARYLVEPFTITVLPFNYSQKVNYLHYNSLYTGREFSLFPHHIENTDNDPLTYQLLKAPQWLEVNPASGELFGIPEANSDIDLLETETIDVTIAVSDGENTYQTSHTLYITKLDDAELILPLTGNLSYSSSTYNFDIDESQGLLSHFNISNELKDRLSVTVINADLLCQNHGLLVGSNGVIILNNYSNNTFTCQFQFIIQDFNQASKVHTANLTFTPDSVPPLINWDSVFIEEDQTTTIDVLANDVIGDKSSAKSTLKITSAPQLGDAEVIDGQIKYTPHPNMFGQDTLSYSFDSPFHGVTGQVTIDINFNNDVPTVTPHTAQLIEDDVSQSISLRALTSDIEDGIPAGAISIISSPTKGAMSFNLQDESIIYTPRANETGIDTLLFTVTDNFGAVSEPGIITFDIEAVNDTPIAQNDTLSTLEDTIKELNILENDSDIEDETFTAENITLEDQGQGTGIYPLANVTVTPAGNLSVSPTPNASGAFSFTYMITDSGGNTSQPSTVDVLIEAVNDVPSADSKKVDAIEEQPIAITLTASDIEQSPLTYKIMSVPKSGKLTIINDVVTYTGNLNFSGADSFTYAAFDQTSWSTPATININVANVQDLPLISGSPATNVKQGQLYDFTPTASDVDNDALSFTINNMPSWLSFNATTGQLVGTPSNDDVNTYTNIAIKVFDGTGYTGLTPFSIEVINVNDAPALTGTPAIEVTQDNMYQFLPTLTDPDVEDNHTFSIINKPEWADFDTSNGALTGTPLDQHVGLTENIIISVKDNAADSLSVSLAPFSITVINSPDIPSAEPFQFTLNEGEALSIGKVNGLLSTATDVDLDSGDTLVAILRDTVKYGTLTLNESGAFTYEHDGSETLEDTFTYRVKDSTDLVSTTQTVTLTINPVDDAPIAKNDEASTQEDTPVTFSLIDNDTDAEQKLVAASAILVTEPKFGSVSITNGIATYTPNEHANGPDSFTYTVSDSSPLTSEPATVNIAVSAVNDVPKAVNISKMTDEDTDLVISIDDIRSQASDIEDTNPTGDITLTSEPLHGVVTLSQADGTLTYIPDLNVVATDTFKYTIADSNGEVSNEATISINIGAINDRPIVENDSAQTDEDTPLTLDILHNDSDVEDQGFNGANITLEDQGKGEGVFDIASVTVNADGQLNIAPAKDAVGELTFTYVLTDSEALASVPATVTVTIKPVNDAPVAENNTATVQEDGSFEINILGNDTDVDANDKLDVDSVTLVDVAKYGTVSLSDSGTATYTPNENFSGTDSFTYTVKDIAGAISNKAEVLVTVEAVNDAPVATPAAVTLAEDSKIEITLTGTDIEKSPLTYKIHTPPANGTLTPVKGAVWTYTPKVNFNGNDSIVFIANDGELDSEVEAVTVTVTPVNDAPEAQSTSATTDEETPLSVTLNGSDIDGDNVSFIIISQPTNGSVTLSGRQVIYTPNDDFTGTDSFSYQANDGSLSSQTAVADILVNNVNDAPSITGTPATTVRQW